MSIKSRLTFFFIIILSAGVLYSGMAFCLWNKDAKITGSNIATLPELSGLTISNLDHALAKLKEISKSFGLFAKSHNEPGRADYSLAPRFMPVFISAFFATAFKHPNISYSKIPVFLLTLVMLR